MLDLKDLIPVKHHDTNVDGRDFIIGDLHGCVDLVYRLMDHVKFDTAKDRLFSTGDLVDRGPDDLGSLALLKEHWFYPVLGNHDAMLMAATGRLRSNLYAGAFFYNGGNLEQFDGHSEVDTYLDLLENTPLIRVVGKDSSSRFQVLHAERVNFGSGETLSDEDLDGSVSALIAKMSELSWVDGLDTRGTWVDRLMWGRSMRYNMGGDHNVLLSTTSRNFVGHTITVPLSDDVVAYADYVFLDTGAFMSKRWEEGSSHTDSFGLTMWDVHNNSGWFANDTGIHAVGVINYSDIPNGRNNKPS